MKMFTPFYPLRRLLRLYLGVYYDFSYVLFELSFGWYIVMGNLSRVLIKRVSGFDFKKPEYPWVAFRVFKKHKKNLLKTYLIYCKFVTFIYFNRISLAMWAFFGL